MDRPIFWITGAPASGKTTLCRALAEKYELSMHIPVDDLRAWVIGGLSESVEWTDETERQFCIAEEATCDLVLRYHQNGFVVIIDHCRNLQRLETLLSSRLPLSQLVKVCLSPSLEVNQLRNSTRKNKDFDPLELTGIIDHMNSSLRENVPQGWHMIDNTEMTVERTVERVISIADQRG